jgi:hypothetical protein
MLSGRKIQKCNIVYGPDYTTFLKRQNYRNEEGRNGLLSDRKLMEVRRHLVWLQEGNINHLLFI